MYKRWRIPGKPVKETVSHCSGRMLPVKNIVWEGLHTVAVGGRTYLADRSVVHDGGGMGRGFTFLEHKEEHGATISNHQNAGTRVR